MQLVGNQGITRAPPSGMGNADEVRKEHLLRGCDRMPCSESQSAGCHQSNPSLRTMNIHTPLSNHQHVVYHSKLLRRFGRCSSGKIHRFTRRSSVTKTANFKTCWTPSAKLMTQQNWSASRKQTLWGQCLVFSFSRVTLTLSSESSCKRHTWLCPTLVDPPQDGYSPLHLAASRNNIEFVKALLREIHSLGEDARASILTQANWVRGYSMAICSSTFGVLCLWFQ
jgi:hypothetical protein